MNQGLRKSGIKIIKDIVWGTHFCQFYQTQEDLMDILIPYFKAGLENNELCIWTIQESFKAKEEAIENLRKAIPQLDIFLGNGQIEIIPSTDWYLKEGIFDSQKILDGWIKKVDQALNNDYNGLRLSEDFSWLRKDWNNLIDYEEKLDAVIGNHRMTVLCTYSLNQCDATETIDVAMNHQFALVKREGKWKKAENPRLKKAEEATIQAAKEVKTAFEGTHGNLEKLVEERTAELEKAHKSLREIEECLAKTQKMAHIGNWEWDIVTGELHWSDEVYRIFERDPERFKATYDAFLSSVHPDDREYLINAIKKGFDGELQNIDYRIILPDGEERAVHTQAEIFFDEKNIPVRAEGIVQDITERKRAEEALQEREEQYRAFFENSIDAVLITSPYGTIHAANPAACKIFGMTEEEITRVGRNGIVDISDPRLKPGLEERARTGKFRGELNYRRKDGTIFPGEVSSAFFKDKNGLVKTVMIIRDITERKQIEEALKKVNETLEEKVKERTVELEKAYNSLKENEKSLAEAQKMAHIGNWDWNLVTNELYASDEMCRIFGLTSQEFDATYEAFLNYVHPADRDYINTAYKDVLNGKKFVGMDSRIVSADGEERVVHGQGEVIFNEENIPVRIRGTVQDITERKITEKALELSEERYRIVAEQTGQLIYDYNVEKGTADWAGNVKEITGYSENLNLDFLQSRIHPEDLKMFFEKYERFLTCGGVYRTEYRFRKENGDYIYIEDNGVCLKDENDKIKRIIGAIKNITERKKTEKALLNIETARKKEIHHRIKNNLQVISSLLDLQAEKFKNREQVKDLEVLEAFRESQDRVISISLIHEELHEGKGTNELNFSPYLEKLVENLFQTYSLGNMDLSLNTDLEENIFFDIDVAVPLGLIVNEIVSNSLKYAFSGRNKGIIQIKLCKEENVKSLNNTSGSKKGDYKNKVTNFILKVSDNGVGIPENINLENSDTLGLQLILILVDQLEGKLELKRDSGTEFVIKFAIPDKE